MFELLHYGFIQRGLAAGIVIALIAPMMGVFLVLRRYALIADTLSHVSLAGIAFGLLFGFNPLVSGLVSTTLSSLIIERLRISKKVYGEMALALFLSGGLALALVFLSLAHGFNVNLFSYLFGSILTIQKSDVAFIYLLSFVVGVLLLCFYKELLYIAFDEEAALVSGIPTRFINSLFIIVAAMTVSLAIPMVGILLISALIVIPVVAALQLGKSFFKTLLYAECISVSSVVFGLIFSYYLNLAPGGTIVLLMLVVFISIVGGKKILNNKN
jgi:zinc transport system permease protein